MEAKVLLQQGNNLQIHFKIDHKKEKKLNILTSKKYLCGSLYFELQAYSTRCVGSDNTSVDYVTILSIRFTKLYKDDTLKYTCKFSSVELEDINKKFTEIDTWHQVFAHKNPNVNPSTANALFTFVISFQCDITTVPGPFASLYDDDCTDFELCGEDGSVKVHKLVLKASSPVLQGMLNGEWKETSEGQITVADASKETCEQFKDYIYLNKLPSTGIEKLLLLGSFFMMPDLVQKCLVKLLYKLDADNIVEMTEFACKFKVTNLFLTLMNIIRSGIISIDHLSEDNLIDMCHATNSILNIKK